jgi:hypothetical protein
MKKPVFPQPDNKSVSVWRYLDLPQLIHLLSTSKLYLPRADLLNDDQEGALCKLKKSVFISSWHIGEEESYAMWRIYSIAPFGLALRTTYKNLATCFKDKAVHVGCVNYIDYSTEKIPDDVFYRYFMHKRKCFAYEQEVRLIKEMSGKDRPIGIEVPIDLKKIIQYIYVSPFAEEWYYNVVGVVIKKFAPIFAKKLKWSNIKEAPLF